MLKDSLNWNDLKYFLEVARSRRLLSASKKLGVNHTTVSRRISALEQALETKLFEQDSAGFRLTRVGEMLMPLAQQLEDTALMARERVKGADPTLSGTLRIGAPDGLGNLFLARWLPEFLQQHAELNLQLVPVPQELNILKREVDIAISLEPSSHRDVICRKITDYRLFLYASKSYIEERELDIESVDSIRTGAFSGYIPDILYSEQLNFNQHIGSALNERFQGATVMSQYQYLASGGGFGVLPYFMACQDDRLIQVMPERFGFLRSYWLLIPGELHRRANIRALAQEIDRQVYNNRKLFMPDSQGG